jgi:hypothetical protein
MASYPHFDSEIELIDVAIGKTATQSSLSPWSTVFGASGVLLPVCRESFGFHTAFEDSPWWSVDLDAIYPIEAIVLHNRRDMLHGYAKTVTVEVSIDGVAWTTIHSGISVFGPGNGAPPLQLPLRGELWARFVRLSLKEKTQFHLSKVEVFVEARLARTVMLRQEIGLRLPLPNEQPPQPEQYEVVAAHPDLLHAKLVGLQIDNCGAFGNSVIQYANAVELALSRGLEFIQVAPGGLIEIERPTKIESMTFLPANAPLPLDGCFLRGYFFHTAPLHTRTSLSYEAIIRDYVRNLFGELSQLHRIEKPADELAIHIRSGDIFSKWVHPNYVQPPLSFYIFVIERLRRENRINSVKLVFEDKLNPVIDRLITWLSKSGLSFSCQSGNLRDDIAALVGAKHLVFGTGTFGAAICYFSDSIETVYNFVAEGGGKFRTISTIKSIFNVSPTEGSYIRTGDWCNSDEQRALMVNYPMSKLVLNDL